MSDETLHHVTRADGTRLAARHRPGETPTLVFLPGLRSDMTGDKANALSGFARERDQAFLRLDYSGHGESGARFEEGSIRIWCDDALAVIDELAPGPVVLVGSSMGGWIALMAAMTLGDRVCGLVGIAAAPDFTCEMERTLDDEQRAAIARGETLLLPAQPDPLPVTPRFLADGEANRVMTGPIPLRCRVRLLHGQNDVVVPWQLSLAVAELVESTDCTLTLVKDGDHRLSRPQDIALLRQAVEGMLQITADASGA